ncbi:hypothetical protein EMPS_10376 [Entomortierella parvispora]|uniref:XPG-I domain-containing protein n=1 Tax=Entomortierella parvispora TaxID=205924 RepID=A0A9P3HKQ7_9FUNG|nr:hypothetical protein EMPS_10376 [Entomortierella parvispora]
MIQDLGVRKARIDVLSFFCIIRNAYSRCKPEDAHKILERHLARFGSKSNLVLYIDGQQALEKEETARRRKESRTVAAAKCMKSLQNLEDLINQNSRPRKRHFSDARSTLAATFYWSLDDRRSFVKYMEDAGWCVQICKTEADVAIAVDCQPDDIVISQDSDFLAYNTVSTLWRPVSKHVLLEYKLANVCLALQLSRAQLTALAIVSRNDYNRNLYSLGPITNYSLIKGICSPDIESIVTAYLGHVVVSNKNKEGQTFRISIQVFVNKQQTPVPIQPAPVVSHDDTTTSNPSFETLQSKFRSICSRYEEMKKIRPLDRICNREIVRLKSSHTKNRYRTVESPAFIRTPPRVQPANEENCASLILSPQGGSSLEEQESHAPLPRTRIPNNRPRYSFKRIEHKKVKKRPPPPKMKQYTWKPHKEQDPKPDKAQPAPKPKAPLRTLESFVEPAKTEKIGVIRSMRYQHPTSSLSIGTLAANVKLALEDEDSLQYEVVTVIEAAVMEATRVKRQAQVLIGTFIEYVDRNGVTEEDRKHLDQFSPRVDMSNIKHDADNPVEVDDDGDEVQGIIDDDGAEEVEDDEGESESSSKEGPSPVKNKKGGRAVTKSGFALAFLCCLYTGAPRTRADVCSFVDRLKHLGLYEPPPCPRANNTMPFTPVDLLESAAGQLERELKMMYKNGTCDVHKTLAAQLGKGLLAVSMADIQIRGDVSAIRCFSQPENHAQLNGMGVA